MLKFCLFSFSLWGVYIYWLIQSIRFWIFSTECLFILFLPSVTDTNIYVSFSKIFFNIYARDIANEMIQCTNRTNNSNAWEMKMSFKVIEISRIFLLHSTLFCTFFSLLYKIWTLILYHLKVWTSTRYVHVCEGVRPDVTLLNMSMMVCL